MKRLIPALLALVMLMGSASAERPVVTALASEINPENLVSVAFDAKINACADGVFNITILVPERYDPDEIKALKVGDGIFTEGREIEIRSITDRDGYIVLNADTEDEVYLYESIDMNYWIADDNDNTWVEFLPSQFGLLTISSSWTESIRQPGNLSFIRLCTTWQASWKE